MKSEIIEPIIAPQIPIKAKGTASFQFISFLLVYITTEKIAGSIDKKFIRCETGKGTDFKSRIFENVY